MDFLLFIFIHLAEALLALLPVLLLGQLFLLLHVRHLKLTLLPLNRPLFRAYGLAPWDFLRMIAFGTRWYEPRS